MPPELSLKNLQEQDEYKFAPEKSQRKLGAVIEVIENLLISVSPDSTFSGASEF